MLVEIQGISLQLTTDPAVFSPRNADAGTLAMLSQIPFEENDKILDLGCGYGVVGIYAARIIGGNRVIMSDIDQKAVALARENAALNQVPEVSVIQSDAYENITESGFTKIISNPPYHADFSVPKIFIERGFNRLVLGGSMFMVTKRKQWYKNKFISIFGGVKIREEDGYFIFTAEKRSSGYAR